VDSVDVTGRINFEKIHVIEEVIVNRRNQFNDRKKYFHGTIFQASLDTDPRKMTLFWTLAYFFISIISNTLVFLEELFFGKLGSPRPTNL